MQVASHTAGRSQRIPTCQPLSAELLMQVIQYIMDHLHGDLSVSSLARRFSLEEGLLVPSLHSHTGITLDQFVLRRRIERALHLLKHSSASDNEIAMRIGWDSAPNFQAAFLKYLGVSPTEYRGNLQLKQQIASPTRRKRPASLPAYRGKNSVDGRFRNSHLSS